MTVLVIDDEECIRDLIRDVLDAPQCDVLDSGSPIQGLTMAREHAPDLVLLDLLMPGMNGLQVLKQLKQAPVTAAIPVVLMSGLGPCGAMAGLVGEGAQEGAAAYLTKPFSPGELTSCVQQVLYKTTAARPRAMAAATGRY